MTLEKAAKCDAPGDRSQAAIEPNAHPANERLAGLSLTCSPYCEHVPETDPVTGFYGVICTKHEDGLKIMSVTRPTKEVTLP